MWIFANNLLVLISRFCKNVNLEMGSEHIPQTPREKRKEEKDD